MGIDVQNSSSEARDHLASERTFLAWIRTSLAFVGLGVVIAKVSNGEAPSTLVLSVLLVLGGMFLSGYAAWRYRKVTERLLSGRFHISTRGPLVFATIVIVSSAALLIWALM